MSKQTNQTIKKWKNDGGAAKGNLSVATEASLTFADCLSQFSNPEQGEEKKEMAITPFLLRSRVTLVVLKKPDTQPDNQYANRDENEIPPIRWHLTSLIICYIFKKLALILDNNVFDP